MPKTLLDNYGRTISYLRLAVTDRCNLRCFYCMPEDGIDWLSRKELLSYEELVQISTLLVRMGVNKIRITGGEPFVRKDVMQFLHTLSKLQGLDQLSITTNGVLTAPMVPELVKIGIHAVNLSIDSIDRNRFSEITHRDELPAVLNTLEQLLKHKIETRLNAVVMEGKNIDDIIPLVELAKESPIAVRFIEEMPFNGAGHDYKGLAWDWVRIIDFIKNKYPELTKIPDPPNSTSYNYHIPGFKGNIGVIAAYTRSFCGTCNRIRITPQGMLKTCLYDNGVLNIRDFIRAGKTEKELTTQIETVINHRSKDGWEAEKLSDSSVTHVKDSMARIGG